MNSGKEMKMISDTGNVVIDSTTLNTYIGGKHIILDAKDTLILRGGSKIIRDDDQAKDVVRGKYDLSVSAEYALKSGKLSLSSGLGATNITSGGPMQQIIGGSSEEIIANKDVFLGNTNAKLIKAINGKIVLETSLPATGGIDLNMGPLGVMSQISIAPITGDMSLTAKAPITIDSTTFASLVAATKASVEGGLVDIIADGIAKIEAASIQLNGSSEQALLGNAFTDLFKEHQHPSSVGPTGAVMPQYTSKIVKTMSQKVFLG